MIGAALGAVGGIAGALASNSAAKQNYQIALLNYYQREKERKEAIRQAERNRYETQLGSTDAQGNRTRFIPGRGWVVELSNGSKSRQDMQNAEQEKVLMHDLPERRAAMDRNIDRSREENYVASGLLEEFKRIRRPSTETKRLQGVADQAGAVNEAFRGTTEDAMKTSLRSGVKDTSKQLSKLNSSKLDALTRAFIGARQGAEGAAEAEYSGRRGSVANLYNMFASRAAAMPDVSYAPQNIDGVSNAMMSQNAGRGDAASQALARAFGMQGGTMDYAEPNMGWANAIGSVGTALGGIQNKQDAKANEDRQMQMLMAYFNGGGNSGFGGTTTGDVW